MTTESTASTKDFGQRPELGWLPVDLLSVDDRYQRKIDSRRSQVAIEQIVQHFKWSCFGTVLVTQQDEGWLIIDGQHRVEAARRLGVKTVPCVVVHQASLAEQASMFVSTNQIRVQVNPYTLFHARMTAGEPLALDVQRLCDEARLSIPKYPVQRDRMAPGQTLALNTLERIVKGGNPAARNGVIAAGHAYEKRAGAATAVILQAAALAAQFKPDDVGAIQSFFSLHDPDALNGQHRGMTGASTLAQMIVKSVENAAKPSPTRGASFIQPPSRDRLMAGR
ncbi:MAG: ParB/RepB/Spo0J family partition protein [Magnetospirillum sp.]|nr:ParB/RepB/Spo0J family partition protein [Magnetospirillum sp.]